MNKRGLSEVVITVLIILISIVAIAIIWVAVRPLFNIDERTNIEDFRLSFDIIDAQYNSQTQVAVVNVKRNAGEGEVIAFNIILRDIDGNSNVYRNDTIIGELESKIMSVSYSGLGELDDVSIAPIFQIGGNERVGSIADTFQFSQQSLQGNAFCGNNNTENLEQCDDGVDDPDDTHLDNIIGDDDGYCVVDQERLTESCKTNICGDGYRNAASEQCDDGNIDDGDSCDFGCFIEVCGNGRQQYDEECDDGDQSNNNQCNNQCQITRCGDGTIQNPNGENINEQCDDGNNEDGDGCSSVCVIETETQCSNGDDDDNDGATDGADFACQQGGPNENSFFSQCQNNADDDGDGWIDSQDSGCLNNQDNNEINLPTLFECSDNVDNSDPEDTLADGNDSGCTAWNDSSENNQPIVCDLTSASWSTSQATEGDLVTLTVQGTNCDGEIVNIELWEDDTPFNDDYIKDLADITMSETAGTSQWIVEYNIDNDGISTDPEYYFRAIVQSNPAEFEDSGIMSVSEEDTCEDVAGFNAVYYVDPLNGNDNSGDGSENNPWKTLAWVASNELSVINSGDVVCLLNGNHGRAYIRNRVYSTPMIIMAQLGHENVNLETIEFKSSENIILDGVRVSPSFASNYFIVGNGIVDVISSSRHITIIDSEIFSVPFAEAMTWTEQEWEALPSGRGVYTDSSTSFVTVDNVKISVIERGVTFGGTDSIIRKSLIELWTADGIRLSAGPNYLVEDSVIQNVVGITYNCGGTGQPDCTHHDAIQFYAGVSASNNAIIRRNLVYAENNHPRPDLAVPEDFQGICKFDGPCNNCVIENNIVIGKQWNGITMQDGAPNSRIIGNTVVGFGDAQGEDKYWIEVGTSNAIVYNNIATRYRISGITLKGNNIDINDQSELPQHFIDWANSNYHIKSTSSARNAGNNTYSPLDDFEGQQRPNPNDGGITDIGADEFY